VEQLSEQFLVYFVSRMLVCVLPRAIKLLDDCMVNLGACKLYPLVAVEEERVGKVRKGSFKSEMEVPGNILIIRRVCSDFSPLYLVFPFLYCSLLFC